MEHLRAGYFTLKKNAAAGIDGETWRHYGENLEANLRDLSIRLQRGAYRARPVRRVYIPKGDGRQRPLGVPTLEDKIVQRAVVAVLDAIYETDFLGFSRGFRPERSPHQALDALTVGIERKKVNGDGAPSSRDPSGLRAARDSERLPNRRPERRSTGLGRLEVAAPATDEPTGRTPIPIAEGLGTPPAA